jgi:hypothetical protein
MKIGGALPFSTTTRPAPQGTGMGAPAAGVPAKSAAREVEPRRTAVTKDELRAAIGRALQRETGVRPDARLVDTLTAHASLETASGDRMYNFNFAGIKGASPAGTTAVLRTKEVLDGREVSIHDGFRAYASIDDGARDYVHLMRTRFAGAMAPASRGDLDGFAHALKQSGYYTAAEKDYAKGLASLSPSGAASGAGAKASRSLAVSLTHVHDALDAARWSVAHDGGSSSADVLDALSSAPSPRGHRVTEPEDDDA